MCQLNKVRSSAELLCKNTKKAQNRSTNKQQAPRIIEKIYNENENLNKIQSNRRQRVCRSERVQ